jgi:sirohydrochlorin cobaltochelatase
VVVTVQPNDSILNPLSFTVDLPPLPQPRPLLMVGHGTRDPQGRQAFLDFAHAYHQLDPCRPIFPCFLELTQPSIFEVLSQCAVEGYTDLSVLPILLFAARHNKFDVTNELDRARQAFPQLRYHYGRHYGIAPEILTLWRSRLEMLDSPEFNPRGIGRDDTVLLVVGRGSSDPDANGDVFKLARMLWEGSGYKTVEVCFIGITHPRLEVGFARANLYQPQRVIVLPHFMFTGALVKKIYTLTATAQQQYPAVEYVNLPEIGLHPQLFYLTRQREIETLTGQVAMNCEACKFRLAAIAHGADHSHHHHHDHNHNHESHSHGHHHPSVNLDHLPSYHQRIWQVP